MHTGIEFPFVAFAQALPVNEIRSALVVAPHPDDESLGCGGTIALLRKAGVPVSVIFVSDGSMSHPGSRKYPAGRLVPLREEEAVRALNILGVEAARVRFMRIKDAAVPAQNESGFAECVHRMREEINPLQPAVLFVPWRKDPHKDHRATAAIVQAALAGYPLPVRILEYFVWLWERSGPEDLPSDKDVLVWRTDIAAVMHLKQKAVMAHASQVTRLIDDDPAGFRLSPEVRQHFRKPVEFFAEGR